MTESAVSPTKVFHKSCERSATLLRSNEILNVVLRFVRFLDQYGELSYDYQSFYASPVGRIAKQLYYRHPLLGTIAVSPMVLSEAVFPKARSLFGKRQRFPIADAHYAMGLLFLSAVLGQDRYSTQAFHFLNVLEQTRCAGYEHYCWGYPFDWETLRGTIKQGTPLITTVPYVYEAFKAAYQLDNNRKWFEIMRSIADHALRDYKDFKITSTASSCTYTPSVEHSVVNANAYRAFLLTSAAVDLSDNKYRSVADRNLNFVIESQHPDGSWYYANDGKRHFTDHFHTCFVLKALTKIEALTGASRCTEAIERGIQYYVTHLFDKDGLPKPFSRAPRLTVYRRELYDYAECVNLATLLKGRFVQLDDRLHTVLNHIVSTWQKPDGSFRGRQLCLGWDNTVMHRWGQSQMFRALCFWLYNAQTSPQN